MKIKKQIGFLVSQKLKKELDDFVANNKTSIYEVCREAVKIFIRDPKSKVKSRSEIQSAARRKIVD